MTESKTSAQEVLRVSELQKRYSLGSQTVHALAGVNLVVEKGDFVAIMGPSGSGKSTLLHLLGGLDRASDGEVTLAGYTLSLLNDDSTTVIRRRSIGFVFQFFNLLPTLTAEENILLPVLIDGQDPKRYRERVHDLLQRVGLIERRAHKPDQLSGGEQQRVAIARALVTSPAIVLADEPTGNLDTAAGTAIMELLRRMRDELGQTTVIVTHDPRAAAYAERVIFLRDGRIAAELRLDAQATAADRWRAIVQTMEGIVQ